MLVYCEISRIDMLANKFFWICFPDDVEIVATDWNCPKHITPRYTAAQIDAGIAPLRERIAELEAQLG